MTAQKKGMDMVWSAIKPWYLKAWEKQRLHSRCMARMRLSERYANVTDDIGIRLTVCSQPWLHLLKTEERILSEQLAYIFPLNASIKHSGYQKWSQWISRATNPQLVTILALFFSIKSSICFGRQSYFYMWSRRVQHRGRLAAKLCGKKLNWNKNRTKCVCV